MRKIFILSLLILFFVSCREGPPYDVSLIETRRPEHVQKKFGEQKIFVQKKYKDEFMFERKVMIFEDKMIKIAWQFDSSNIRFTLENKTKNTIKLIWDEAVYIDENNRASKLIHGQVRFIHSERSHPPSVIPAGCKFSTVVFPLYNVYSGGTHAFYFKEGDLCKVLLPIKIENVIYDYVFTFKVEKVLEYRGD